MKLKQFKIRDVVNRNYLLISIPFMSLGVMASTPSETLGASISLLSHVHAPSENSMRFQQQLTGQVTDANGRPLSGVEVRNLNTDAFAVTGQEGRFTLNASASATLQFRLVGFNGRVLNGGETHVVILHSSGTALDEVVVVGYGNQKKVNLTGAVSSVRFDEATDSRPAMNLSSALVGMSSGLNIAQTSATPGAEGFNIMVRGMGTMNDASPLVVIDGVPGALNDVNPNDVESVSILKDASSAAIYGSRAANGVILVTTRRGSEGNFTVTYNGYMGQQNTAKDIAFITDMATHMELVNESEGRDKYSVDLIDQWRKESAAGNPLYPNTDWYDEMLNSSLLTEHNVSMRGGGQKGNFAMSLGYLDN